VNNSEPDKSALDSPAPRPEAPHETRNPIANLLQIVGAVALVGMLVGFVIGVGGSDDTNWAVGVPIMISSAIVSLLFFGFAEIIRLLEKIVQNMAK
jgi:hypothetical protein